MVKLCARLLFVVASAACGVSNATVCGSITYPFPYTDVTAVGDAFCPGIMESYVLGVTKGTTATTFSPNDPVPRLQMTTFLQRSIDQGLRRNNRRNVMGQWWIAKEERGLEKISLPGPGPASFCRADGTRIWVGNGARYQSVDATSGEVAADATFPGITNIGGVLVANGRVYFSDASSPSIVRIYPSFQAPFYYRDAAAVISLLFTPNNLTFDGNRIWTANVGGGTVTILPLRVDGIPQVSEATTVGGFTFPLDVLYDGNNIWVTDAGSANVLRKLNSAGGVVQNVPVGAGPAYMTFDGANLWVPNFQANSISVVQASTGAVVATIASNATNRISAPLQAAFDGERILVTNSGNDSISLFRAADLSLIGNIALTPGSGPIGACSDGINFWVVLRGTKQLLRV